MTNEIADMSIVGKARTAVPISGYCGAPQRSGMQVLMELKRVVRPMPLITLIADG